MDLRIATTSALAGVLVACADDGGDVEGTASPGTAAGEAEERPQAPVLTWDGPQPPRIATHRRADLEFPVAEIGRRTALVLDGIRLGQSLAGPVATLTGSELALHFGGAMLPGSHTIQLQWGDPDHVSALLEVGVVAEPNAGIAIEWLGEDLGAATRLLSGGSEDGGALGLLRDDVAPAFVTVFAARDEGWDATSQRFELAGFCPQHDEVAVGNATHPAGTPWAAWTQGQVPRTVMWADLEGSREPVLDLEDLQTPHEFARLGRLQFVGESLLVERSIFADVEDPRPADATLVRIRSVGGVRGAPEVLGLLTMHDAFAPVPVIDVGLWRWQRRHLVLAHRRYTSPALLSLGHDAQVREATLGEDPSFLATAHIGAAFAGAFDTRIFAVRDESKTNWQLVTMTHSSGEGPHTFDLGIPVAEAPVCSPTQIGGFPVLLFPRGFGTPAWAVVVDTPTPSPFELPELQCDALVVRSSMVADVRGRAAMACLQGGRAHLGAVALRSGPARG